MDFSNIFHTKKAEARPWHRGTEFSMALETPPMAKPNPARRVDGIPGMKVVKSGCQVALLLVVVHYLSLAARKA
jgi:hypothetical protein